MTNESKRYYWLKLKKSWFNSKHVKKIRRMPGGDRYTIIYLQLMLMSLEEGGCIYYENIEDDLIKEIALELGEDEDNIKNLLALLEKFGLIEFRANISLSLTEVLELTGQETESAVKKREYRERLKNTAPKAIEGGAETDISGEVSEEISSNVPNNKDGYIVYERELTSPEQEEKTMRGQKKDNVREMSEKCPTDIDIDIDIEKEIDIDIDIEIDSCTEPKRSEQEADPPEKEKQPDVPFKQKCERLNKPQVFIMLPLNQGEAAIYVEIVNQFKDLYPSVDVEQELRAMKAWLMTNPTRRKTKNGIMRFVNSWLAKEQNKGRHSFDNRAPNTGYQSRYAHMNAKLINDLKQNIACEEEVYGINVDEIKL